MRLESFASDGITPIGQGEQKKVFVDPKNEKRIIAEIKKATSVEKYSPRQLKGAFYLTKIIHNILPKNIPNIYQVSTTTEGTQTIDRERVAHTSGHAALQEAQLTKQNE